MRRISHPDRSQIKRSLLTETEVKQTKADGNPNLSEDIIQNSAITDDLISSKKSDCIAPKLDVSSIEKLMKSHDFVQFTCGPDHNIQVSYIRTLIDQDLLQRDILRYLDTEYKNLNEIENIISVQGKMITDQVQKVEKAMLEGGCLIQITFDPSSYLLVPIGKTEHRTIGIPEVEYSVVGPKDSFVESKDVNISLIRRRLPLSDFQLKELIVGRLTKTKVIVMHIAGLANSQLVDTVVNRIQHIEYDHILDSSYIAQLITDNPNSIFPQVINTERPDRAVAALTEGKVVIVVDGASQVLIAPTTGLEFISAFEDYFLNWIVASFFRIVRLFAVIFSIMATPSYVAILTYHYQMIPMDLLATLVSSRADIPFPPIVEALILEFAIELLREAGAKLPTKVGQTIGIVGGIVIGTASVEAGLTSNVLLIIVAVGALASFTTPIYTMGNTIRVLRFPFLIFAQLWGLLGIMISLGFLIAHLLRLRSMGNPYLEPIAPFRFRDFKDAIIRLPFSMQNRRPIETLPKDKNRFESNKS
ncbi:spore germination protein [Risungbinella massiliensis]|uniref:spore germination protein n=1 Tax=Risungbinella massiliensis TaxID=1329796 RepID=UPI000AE369FE|nr:spore germination protein [Risungbinella massiliensis]